MKKRNVCALALAAVMAGSLTACSGGGSQTGAADAKAEAPATTAADTTEASSGETKGLVYWLSLIHI